MTENIAVKYDRDTSRHWAEDSDVNTLVIRAVQNHLNDKLKARGHVFLNEVLDELGLSRVRDGQFIGWLEGSHIEIGMRPTPGEEGSIDLWIPVDGKIIDHLEEL